MCPPENIHVYGHVSAFGLNYPVNVTRYGRGGPPRPPGIHPRVWSRFGIRS